MSLSTQNWDKKLEVAPAVVNKLLDDLQKAKLAFRQVEYAGDPLVEEESTSN